jgi:hypothetical protein
MFVLTQSNGCSNGKPTRPLQSPMKEELTRIDMLFLVYELEVL